MERIEHRACFGGWQDVYQHASATLGCVMRFAIYLPPQAGHAKVPVLYWLSGLTCTEQNFITKAGFQQHAAEHGLIVVAPDTSPRGEGVANGFNMQAIGFMPLGRAPVDNVACLSVQPRLQGISHQVMITIPFPLIVQWN